MGGQKTTFEVNQLLPNPIGGRKETVIRRVSVRRKKLQWDFWKKSSRFWVDWVQSRLFFYSWGPRVKKWPNWNPLTSCTTPGTPHWNCTKFTLFYTFSTPFDVLETVNSIALESYLLYPLRVHKKMPGNRSASWSWMATYRLLSRRMENS